MWIFKIRQRIQILFLYSTHISMNNITIQQMNNISIQQNFDIFIQQINDISIRQIHLSIYNTEGRNILRNAKLSLGTGNSCPKVLVGCEHKKTPSGAPKGGWGEDSR